MLRLLNAILVLFIFIPLNANKSFYFDHLDIAEGLSQNTVTCILQDKKGFMWFGTKNGLNRFDGYSFSTYSRNDGLSGLGNSIIYCMAEDSHNKLWVGTDKGVWVLDNRTYRFSFFDVKLPDGKPLDYTIYKIVVHDNQVWFLTANGIYIYVPGKDELEPLAPKLHTLYPEFPSPSDICADGDKLWISVPQHGIVEYENGKCRRFYDNERIRIMSLCVDRNMLFAGASEGGLYVINKLSKDVKVENVRSGSNGDNSLIRVISKIDNEIWIGTEDGIFVYDLAKKAIVDNIVNIVGDSYSLSNNAVYSIFQDSQKGIWVGTYFGGINYIPKHDTLFEKYYQSSEAGSIVGQRVREMVEDPLGNLWIATEDNGLNYFNTKTRKFKHYSMNTSDIRLSYNNIQCLDLYGNSLWIGYYHKGIDRIDLRNKTLKHYETANCPSLDNNDIFTIYTDLSGQTWVGTSTGVLKYEPSDDRFIPCPEIGVFYISDIQQDPRGYIWFATYNVGAIRYNPKNKTCRIFNYNPDDSTSICYTRITTIFEDSKQRLWFGSEDGGFCRYDEKTETFKRITTADGLLSNVVHKIVEDRYGRLWISTNNGIACYDTESGKIENYNTQNGLLSRQFNYNSGLAASDGKIYFGNISGMISFIPDEAKDVADNRNVILTDFKVFNSRADDNLYRQSIAYADTVVLAYDASSFSIEFSTLNYSSIETNRYAYMLEGVDKDWIYTSSHSVAYNNLSPGKYVFRVKADNSDGRWNNKETILYVIITPPWWLSGIAKFLYAVIFVAACYFGLRLYRKRLRQQQLMKEQEHERSKQEEIYTAKIDFFTNIAHEIRTPLTLIKIPLESIIDAGLDSVKAKDYLQIIKRNTDRLFFLINQLLDFRKTESKTLKLNKESVDINTLVADTLLRFRPAMEQNGIDVEVSMPDTDIVSVIDKEAITKVLSNLFTNATKYGKSHVQIRLSENAEQGYFEIRVSNDGKRIPKELSNKVFEAFFQVKSDGDKLKSGSGLGLALAKSLVELHDGSIFIDDKSDDTTFVVRIPILRQGGNIQQLPVEYSDEKAMDVQTDALSAENEVDDESEAKSENSILLVEDNKELLSFMKENLSKKWNVFAASNGAEALAILDKEKVSVVVSDIVMPIIDGIELCRRISSNVSTCNIPVILLTARTNTDSKIEALRSGVAAYIEKPFSMVQLEEQIKNLIDSQTKLKKNLSQNQFIDSGAIARNKSDERFLNKVTEIIVQNIEKENFNVDDLADELCMSRTSLHRKLKGISEYTPGDFIRYIRLKKASELLMNGEYRINEICLLVGFHSQSYFTKSFYKQFGVLPKDYVKSVIGKDKE